MDCRKLVRRSLRWWREYLRVRRDKNVPGIRGRYVRFASQAKVDLEFLCGKGANPWVLIHIIDTEMFWWGGHYIWAARTAEQARRKFSSHIYWAQCLKVLEKADDLLAWLRTYDVVRIAALLSPDYGETALIPLSKHVLDADDAIRQLVHTIRALGLHNPNWELRRVSSRHLPAIVKTAKSGKSLGGRSREEDWAMCAGKLHAYLKLSTRQPHWGSVVRLLKHAGAEGFAGYVPREGTTQRRGSVRTTHDLRWIYRDKVRQRVMRLRKDTIAWDRVQGTVLMSNMLYGRDGMPPIPA